MKHIHTFIVALAAALLLCSGCNPNAPKYESVLDEVLSCMVPDRGNDDVHLVGEDVEALKATLSYHCGFEKAPQVKDLRRYLYPIEDNFMFRSSDGTEAMKLDKDIYGPAVDSLCTYVEEGGEYPAATILKAIYHLQDQFARAMETSPQIGVGAAIWLNRFTQQAVKYCPDIRLLTDTYRDYSEGQVGIIVMPEGERKPTTNIIVSGPEGDWQVLFGVHLYVNRILDLDGGWRRRDFLLYRGDCRPEDFVAVVLGFSDAGSGPEILGRSIQGKDRAVVREWLAPALGQEGMRLFPGDDNEMDLVVDCGDHQQVRSLVAVRGNYGYHLEFDPERNIKREIKSFLRENYADMRWGEEWLPDSLSNPRSAKWDRLFSIEEKFLRDWLPWTYSHDGQMYAFEYGPGDVVIADYSKRRLLPRRFAGDSSDVSSIQFSPDDTRLLVQSWSGRIAIFDIRSGKLIKEARKMESRNELDVSIAYDWEGGSGYVADGRKLYRLNLDEGVQEFVDTLSSSIYDIQICRSGELFINASDGVVFYNPGTKVETVKIPIGDDDFQNVALSPNERFVLTVNGTGTIRLWDIDALDRPWEMECPCGYDKYIGFSNDGSRYILIEGGKVAATEGPLYLNY